MTPPPPPFPTPVSVSERDTIDRGLARAQASAQALGGVLGVWIQDLNTGVSSQLNGDQPFPMAGLQQLPLDILAQQPGARLDAGIDIEAHGVGFATPNAFAHLLEQLYTDTLLDPRQTAQLLRSLDTQQDAAQLRAGLPPHTQFEHLSGTLERTPEGAAVTNDAGIAHLQGHVLLIVAMLRGAGGTPAQRDAVLARVAQAAVAGALAVP